MTVEGDVILARRYLLGEAADEERERLERDYFADEAALERLEAVEEALIEDYLADVLPADQRNRFERQFLSAPRRRARVDTIRALTAAAARADRALETSPFVAKARRSVPWALSLAAAAVVLFATAAVWEVAMSRGGRPSAPDIREGSGAPASAPARGSIQTFALSLSPAGTRSEGTTPDVIVPPGTDAVNLRLDAEPRGAPIASGRAVVRTVSGREAWSGPLTGPSERLRRESPRRLPFQRRASGLDDYVITLFAVDPRGVEREAYRYFLRVVAR